MEQSKEYTINSNNSNNTNEWTPERIKKLREKLGITQKELAKYVGYDSYFPIYEFEGGRRKPNKRVAIILEMIEKSSGYVVKSMGD